MDETQLYISDVAEMVNRKPATIRDWERRGILPRKLQSKRAPRGWRYWTPDQVEGIKDWMLKKDMRPGKGLPHYKPTPAEVDKHLEGQRQPRKREAVPA
jgi:hypothetical protein